MSKAPSENRIPLSPSRFSQDSPNPGAFRGFARPQSNTTFTPNQFFDIVIRNAKKTGIIRAVSYLLRQTLGWCDANGLPKEVEILCTHKTLVQKAGINTARVAESVAQCVKAGYFKTVKKPQAASRGTRPVSGLYELLWDEVGEYTTNSAAFNGFFAREGNRTYIPNEFFDVVIPNEKLAVIKIVGALFRDTIGFQTKFGHRRTQVSRSITELAKLTGLSTSTVRITLDDAALKGFIVRLDRGLFDPKAGANSRAATYGIRWEDSQEFYKSTFKIATETPHSESEGTFKIATDEHLQNPLGGTFKIATDEHLQNRYDIKIKQENNTSKKQQRGEQSANGKGIVVGKKSATHEMLLNAGFDEQTALLLAEQHSPEVIERQVAWLSKRTIKTNRLGFLRKAIENDYDAPDAGETAGEVTEGGVALARGFYEGFGEARSEAPAEPSDKDLQQASVFATRLLEIEPDKNRLGDWGKKMGRLSAEQQLRNPAAFPSFVNSVRLRGNQFVKTLRQTSEKRRRQFANEERLRHEEAYYSKWIEYVREQEQGIRTEQPEAYQEFLDYRTTKREEIEGQGVQFAGLKEQWLQTFDSERSHLEAFREFFQDHILGFWGWDREINPERLLD